MPEGILHSPARSVFMSPLLCFHPFFSADDEHQRTRTNTRLHHKGKKSLQRKKKKKNQEAIVNVLQSVFHISDIICPALLSLFKTSFTISLFNQKYVTCYRLKIPLFLLVTIKYFRRSKIDYNLQVRFISIFNQTENTALTICICELKKTAKAIVTKLFFSLTHNNFWCI